VWTIFDLTLGVQLELFAPNRVVHVGGECFESIVDGLVGKFDNASTVDANEVIVLGILVVNRVVSGLTVAEILREGKSLFDEELESSVDGGVSDTGLFVSNVFEQFVGRDVLIETKESLDDEITLASRFESLLLEALVERLHDGLDASIVDRRRFVRRVACRSIFVGIVHDSGRSMRVEDEQSGVGTEMRGVESLPSSPSRGCAFDGSTRFAGDVSKCRTRSGMETTGFASMFTRTGNERGLSVVPVDLRADSCPSGA
jgi:hypothetical protein